MTISDIAKLAGVSSAAVSRYLNGGPLSEQKRAVIQAVVEKTGYSPDTAAQTLRTGKVRQVGVIVPSISSQSVGQITSGIAAELGARRYLMLLADTELDEQMELEYLTALQRNHVAGIILLGYDSSPQLCKALKDCRVPVVVTGQRFADLPCVYNDDRAAARDLTRALDDAREDLKRCKQRLSKFLLRHGLVFSETNAKGQRKKNWTAAHWAWIRSISFPDKADDEVLAYYIDAARQAMEDKARLERLVEAEASKPRWKKRVDSLRCLKGIDVMTAADIVFEAGEFARFRNARSFAAWLGLTPSEHSSGEKVAQGGITKAGNKHLRRVMVEAAWHYLSASPHSKGPAPGQAPDPAARRHASKGVRRLVGRRAALLERGVHKNKANVATARELACWCWAVGSMAEGAR